MTGRRLSIIYLLLTMAACQPFTTISEDDEHVTYQFDPTRVEQARIAEAALDKCEMSPLGSRPAVLVSSEDVGALRQLSFVCKAPDQGLDIGPALDRALGRIPAP